MKLFAGILAFYIFSLTVLPCDDFHLFTVSNNTETTCFTQENQDNHEHDLDFCSPFCYCSCCQTFTETLSIQITPLEFETISVIVKPIIQIEKENNFSFWRPPEV